jgi:hypothetical protein
LQTDAEKLSEIAIDKAKQKPDKAKSRSPRTRRRERSGGKMMKEENMRADTTERIEVMP